MIEEVEVPRLVLWVMVASVVTGLLVGIGLAVSPRTDSGRPVVLSPPVRAVALYRGQVQQWVARWIALTDDMETMLSGDAAELLALSQTAHIVFTGAIALAQEVDRAEAPAPMLGLHEQARGVSQIVVEASLAVARWVSTPTAGQRAGALALVAGARVELDRLVQNGWVR